MRILADIPEIDIRWLDERAAAEGRSRAALLREAVSHLRERVEQDERQKRFEAGFGAWAHRTDIGDAVDWQRRESARSTRPWDDDYEEVRAEFPDLFDAEDDRQRQIYLDMKAGILRTGVGKAA